MLSSGAANWRLVVSSHGALPRRASEERVKRLGARRLSSQALAIWKQEAFRLQKLVDRWQPRRRLFALKHGTLPASPRRLFVALFVAGIAQLKRLRRAQNKLVVKSMRRIFHTQLADLFNAWRNAVRTPFPQTASQTCCSAASATDRRHSGAVRTAAVSVHVKSLATDTFMKAATRAAISSRSMASICSRQTNCQSSAAQVSAGCRALRSRSAIARGEPARFQQARW